jgi:hypothetical protein
MHRISADAAKAHARTPVQTAHERVRRRAFEPWVSTDDSGTSLTAAPRGFYSSDRLLCVARRTQPYFEALAE